MFFCNSESEESLENMKLDLIKAKYAYHKMKNTDLSREKESNNGYWNSRHQTNSTIDSKKFTDGPKIFHSPKMSKRKHEKNPHKSIEFEVDKSFDKTEDVTDEEDTDLLKMNSYVDYLLNRKRNSINSYSDKSINLDSMKPNEESPILINNYEEAYQRNSFDYNQLNIPQSTDILVQWRLRRKINEAQNSVKLEHQKHNMHIHSLYSKTVGNNPGLPISSVLQNHESFNDFQRVDRVKYAFENEYDQVPVRDKIYFSNETQTSVQLPEVVNSKSKRDTGCQCNLDKYNQICKSDSHKMIQIKPRRHSKNKNVGEMTRCMNKSKKFDECTQTKSYNICPKRFEKTKALPDWDPIISSPDYIDIAIENSVQAQLLERNNSSAMSIVTSINDSNNLDVMIPNSNPSYIIEKKDKDFTNIDTSSEEIPWNEHFQIMSDDEFQQDQVLMDLRRRRNLNLIKLQNLSAKIQKYQNCNLTSIES